MTQLPSPTLLLVNESQSTLTALAPALARHFQIRWAVSVKKALERLHASPPSMVVLGVDDINDDALAGCRMLAASRTADSIPVIVVAGRSCAEQRAEALRIGAVDFVSAPITADEVVARIHAHLRRTPVSPAPRQPLGAARRCATPPTGLAALDAATSYIAEHMDCLPAVEVIARRVGTSEKQLLKLFRETLGSTISGYIRDQRIKIGSLLLDETEMAVYDIAVEVGFSRPANFATAFKEQTGTTPVAFRQALREGRKPAPVVGAVLPSSNAEVQVVEPAISTAASAPEPAKPPELPKRIELTTLAHVAPPPNASPMRRAEDMARHPDAHNQNVSATPAGRSNARGRFGSEGVDNRDST